MLKISRILLLVSICFSAVQGDEGTTAGFDFLRWDTGARVSAMGSAYTAGQGDLTGLQCNPAVLFGAANTGGSVSYYRYFLDIQSGFAGFHKKLHTGGMLGISIGYVNYGQMNRTNRYNDDLGTFNSGDMIFSAAYSDSSQIGLIWGGTVKFITSKLDEYSASAAAVDAGIIYPIPSQNIRLGLSILNMGTAVSSYISEKAKLPLTIRGGISKRLAHLPLLLHADLLYYVYQPGQKEGGFYWAIGGEFTVTNRFYLRWGYNSRGAEQKVSEGGSTFSGFSAGIGIDFDTWKLDCGWAFYGILGDVPSATFSMVL